MAGPTINIKSISRTKISRINGVDSSEVVFTTNQDLTEWQARADGQGVGQGLLVGSGKNLFRVMAWSTRIKEASSWTSWRNTDWNSFIGIAEGSFIVDDEELTNGDKLYRINVYGKNKNGEWNAYGQ